METERQDGTEAVQRLIGQIIERGSVYDAEALEALYADDVQIVRVGADGAVRTTGKQEALRFFRTMRESGSAPLSTAARVRVTEVGDQRAHALVLREMQVEGMPRRLVFSIECERGEDGWRVRREVAVAQS